MSPTLGPELAQSTPTHPHFAASALPLRRSSTSSIQSIPDNASVGSSSSLSIPFDHADVEAVRVEGLRHAEERLEARRYKQPAFVSTLLTILRAIRAPTWSNPDISPASISIQKVSGSLTNAVFFASAPAVPGTRTVLLRIYGPLSGALIERPRELRILHVLSSAYRIGPRVYGTFENGRVEEYFDSAALSAADLRDPEVSRWIGARMAELHGVDVRAVDYAEDESVGQPHRAAKKNVREWLPLAAEVLALPGASQELKDALALEAFAAEWKRYLAWVDKTECTQGASTRVFAHNDAQYGNLLRLRNPQEGLPAHRQIIVVDFEYAAPNPAAFDIANHFHEWTADYHGPTPHRLDPARYPSPAERDNFYRAYLAHTGATPSGPDAPHAAADADVAALDAHVRVWSPASHAMWAVWGVVQAREFVEGKDAEPEFDYLAYACGRMEGFRREIAALGI